MNKKQYLELIDNHCKMIQKISAFDFDWLMQHQSRYEPSLYNFDNSTLLNKIVKCKHIIPAIQQSVLDILNIEVEFKHYDSIGNLFFVAPKGSNNSEIYDVMCEVIQKSGIKDLEAII